MLTLLSTKKDKLITLDQTISLYLNIIELINQEDPISATYNPAASDKHQMAMAFINAKTATYRTRIINAIVIRNINLQKDIITSARQNIRKTFNLPIKPLRRKINQPKPTLENNRIRKSNNILRNNKEDLATLYSLNTSIPINYIPPIILTITVKDA